MRYCILSDIHGNWEALKAVLCAAEESSVHEIICAGDVVGYGANPHECIQECLRLRIPCVAGNHDWGACGLFPVDRFNPMAQVAIHWTQHQLLSDDIDFLTHLPLIYQDNWIITVHGTLESPDQFHYLSNETEAREMFSCFKQEVCFVGHTHVPRIFRYNGREAENIKVSSVQIDSGLKFIVNVGSVGQPRDGDPRAAYCIYDVEKRHLELKRVPYSTMDAQQQIRRHGLPDYLAQRLTKGI